VERALLATVDAVERDTLAICEELADVLTHEVDAIPDDARTHADIVRRAQAQINIIVRDYRRGTPPGESNPPPEAIAYARFLARRGVGIDVFLRIHRLGFAVMLRGWEERLVAVDSVELALEATRHLLDHLFAHQDFLLESLSTEYQRERERFVRSADARRRETIGAILAGDPVDLDRAGSILGHDLRRHHIGLVVWAGPSTTQAGVGPALERAAARAADWFGASRSLTMAEGTATLWVWIGLPHEPTAAAREAYERTVEAGGVSVAIGDPGSGLDGFRRTHRDAADAARVAQLGERRVGTITPYRSVDLAAMFAEDLVRARRFVREHLGPLAREDDEAARLRATLLPYLEESGSRIATARRLGVHPNTVANRIRTCSTLLDRDLSRRQLRLQLALKVAENLGPAVLRDTPPL
jgi:DNA-binding PucR family transcriptional regulator